MKFGSARLGVDLIFIVSRASDRLRRIRENSAHGISQTIVEEQLTRMRYVTTIDMNHTSDATQTRAKMNLEVHVCSTATIPTRIDSVKGSHTFEVGDLLTSEER